MAPSTTPTTASERQPITCRACRHFDPVSAESAFGRCETGAWITSYTPRRGYALTPAADIPRHCASHGVAAT